MGAVIMLAGVALQCSATTIGMFIGARGLSAFYSLSYLPPSVFRLSVLNLPRGAVGFGLTFVLAAAPLLITELAYPTQVRRSICSVSPE